MSGEGGPATSGPKDVSDRNSYVIVSFVLGFLAGLYGTQTGLELYFAGWPAHGPVGVLGVFQMVSGLLTILGSLLVLSRRVRIVGAVVVLFFGLMASLHGVFSITSVVTRLLLPILSFVFALYAAKQDRTPP